MSPNVSISDAAVIGPDELYDRVSRAVELDVGRTGATVFAIDPEMSDTKEFATRYEVAMSRCANCIVTASGRGENVKFAMALVPATHRLDTKVVQREVGGKTSFARPDDAARATGMQFGAITPLGRDERMPLFVAADLLSEPWVIIGGGVREVKVAVAPSALTDVLGAVVLPGLAVAPAVAGGDAS